MGEWDGLDAYKRYLAGSYDFRRPLEERVAHLATAAGLSWEPTVLHPLLAQDQRDLQCPPPEFVATEPATSNDVEGLMGALYVLEGSSIGARLLSDRAHKLGLHGGHGARHLERQHSAVQNWRSFLASLEATPHLEMERVIASAIAAFECAHRAFRRAAAT